MWEDQAAIDAFARSDPHRQIVRRLAAHMGQTRFATVTVDGDAVPTTWAEITAPLAEIGDTQDQRGHTVGSC